MNKKVLKTILTFALILFCLTITNSVFAAGSFSLNKNSATIKEGSTTTFKIDGSNATGRVDIKSSDTSIATVSSSSQWLENNSATITITGKKAGTATITVSGEVSDSEGNEASITKKINVTVKEKASSSSTNSSNSSSSSNSNTSSSSTSNSTTTTTTKSNNAYLSTLGVTPKEYDFSGFSKTKTSYSVTIPNDVDSLKVSYKTADSKATVEVSGNTGFDVGSNNKITVKVTAEDGKTTKTYTIKVTKLAATEEQPGNLIDDSKDNEGLYLTSLKLNGLDINPEFSKTTYAYTATLEDTSVTEINVEAKANNEKANIEITGNTGLVAGENTINILVTLEGSEIQTVYQIILTKVEKNIVENNVFPTIEEQSSDDLIENLKRYTVSGIIIIVLIISVVIILIILLRKENKRLKEDEEEIFESKANENNEYTPNEEKMKKRDKGKHSL